MSDFIWILGVFALVWAILYFMDFIFRSCMFFPYIKFLHDTGFTIKPYGICWETMYFNRFILKMQQIWPSGVRKWFQFGALMVTLSVIPCLLIILFPVYNYYASQNSPPALMPIVPGFTIPISHLPYYMIAVFISMIFHEFGHALAAVREKVSIDGYGFSVFLFFPMAFVALNTEQLKQLTKSEQLRICSAGVWHNMVLCFSTCLLVLISPVILKPFYEQGHGITVVEIQKGTGLDQKGGLMINDVIIDVNECPVKTMMDWENCLNQEYLNSQSGFCVSEEMYKKENSVVEVGSWNCCQNTSEKMCFRHSDLKMSQQLMCLPVRKMTEKAEICKNNLDCREKLCLVPVLDMNSERLLRIGVYSRNAVYYIGGIESFSFVSVGRWIAKTSLPAKYVDVCEMFIGYIFAFSSGIAIINIIPLFCLDGNYIIECIIHLFLKSYIPISSNRNKFIFVLKVIGHVSLIACGFSVLITYYV